MAELVTLFHYNTLGALMAGLYKGTMTIEELLQHGDLGIGTLDSIDGELIVLDGKAYQAKGIGSTPEVIEVSTDRTVPYAAVAFHRAEACFRQDVELTDEALKKRIEASYVGENLFRSIKIHGEFSSMKVRIAPKSYPGKRFAEIAAHQSEYHAEHISGTIVGFWTPELFHGVSVAGYHLHFLSDDHQFGGHVMDFVMKNGEVEIGTIVALEQRFPVQDQDFLSAKLNVAELKEDIEKSE